MTDLHTNQSDAKQANARMYSDGIPCKGHVNIQHPCGSTVKYTVTGKCLHCSKREAPEFMAYLKGHMILLDTDPLDVETFWKGQIEGRPDFNRPIPTTTYELFKKEAKFLQRTHVAYDPREALENVLGLWVSPEPCKAAGHLGIKYPDGKCFICDRDRATAKHAKDQERDRLKGLKDEQRRLARRKKDQAMAELKTTQPLSPRAQAIKDKAVWYMPTSPCSRCNTISERRVNNGACKGCI